MYVPVRQYSAQYNISIIVVALINGARYACQHAPPILHKIRHGIINKFLVWLFLTQCRYQYKYRYPQFLHLQLPARPTNTTRRYCALLFELRQSQKTSDSHRFSIIRKRWRARYRPTSQTATNSTKPSVGGRFILHAPPPCGEFEKKAFSIADFYVGMMLLQYTIL
jgi:hypothetical protein